MTRPRISETALVHACLELIVLRYPLITAWRQNQGALKIAPRFDQAAQRMRKGRYVKFADRAGISDIMGFIAPTGRTLAIECKVRPNRLTTDQADFVAAVNASGGLALVVFDDVMELDRLLREEGLAGGR